MQLNLIKFSQCPILRQLQIEEALLRADDGNWCLINEGSSDAIVMGISGKPEKLINSDALKSHPVPIIKRFSGGGTVIVDQDTLFVSFIFNHDALAIAPFPQAIMKWSEQFYRPLFAPHDFLLKENDYVIGEKKCGGNAQYIQRKRWLHHTSFLWDYQEQKMNLLLMPEKRPAYRNSRSHSDFLRPLKELLDCKQTFLNNLYQQLNQKFDVIEHDPNNLSSIVARPHRKATHTVN